MSTGSVGRRTTESSMAASSSRTLRLSRAVMIYGVLALTIVGVLSEDVIQDVGIKNKRAPITGFYKIDFYPAKNCSYTTSVNRGVTLRLLNAAVSGTSYTIKDMSAELRFQGNGAEGSALLFNRNKKFTLLFEVTDPCDQSDSICKKITHLLWTYQHFASSVDANTGLHYEKIVIQSPNGEMETFDMEDGCSCANKLGNCEGRKKDSQFIADKKKLLATVVVDKPSKGMTVQTKSLCGRTCK